MKTIEEKSLKNKKEAANQVELEEMKKDFERLQKRVKETGETLLHELEISQKDIFKELDDLLALYYRVNSTYYHELAKIWPSEN